MEPSCHVETVFQMDASSFLEQHTILTSKSARLKSQVFELRWAPQGIEGSVSSAVEMVGGGYRGGPASMRTIGRGVSKFQEGGWDAYAPKPSGASTSSVAKPRSSASTAVLVRMTTPRRPSAVKPRNLL